jgi:hypothetical protein
LCIPRHWIIRHGCFLLDGELDKSKHPPRTTSYLSAENWQL